MSWGVGDGVISFRCDVIMLSECLGERGVFSRESIDKNGVYILRCSLIVWYDFSFS